MVVAIQINVLGPLEATLDDVAVEGITRSRAQQLLMLLAARADTWSTIDFIADQLWPGDPPQSPRRTIQTIVSRIRGEFADRANEVIDAGPNGYRLNQTTCLVDLTQWHDLVYRARSDEEDGLLDQAAELHERAERLWRDRPFSGDFPSVEHLEFRADQLETAHTDAQFQRARVELKRRRIQEAGTILGPLATATPLREDIAVAAMNVLHACGRTEDALRVRTTHFDAIAELGLIPGTQAVQAEQRLVNNTPSDLAPPFLQGPVPDGSQDDVPATSATPREVSWRPDLETQFFASLLESIDHSRGVSVHSLSAPLQYGLSSVLRRAVAKTRSERSDVQVDFVTHRPGDQHSLRPGLIDFASPPMDREIEIADVVARLSAATASDGNRHRLLVVDDAHLLDSWSLTFLETLSRLEDRQPNVTLVIGEHPTEAPLAVNVDQEWRLGSLRHQDRDSEVEALLQAAIPDLRARELSALATQLHSFLSGHPLHIHQAIESLSREGADAAALDAEAIQQIVPRSATTFAQRLVTELDDTNLPILQTAAVLAAEVDPHLLCELAEDVSIHQVVQALGAAERAGVLEPALTPGNWRFPNQVIVGVLAQPVPDHQRRLMHLRAAKWYQSTGTRPIKAARHMQAARPLAGDVEIAEASRIAGEQLLGGGAFDEAVAHLRAAVDLTSNDAVRRRTLFSLALTHERLGNAARADELFTDVIELAAATDDHALLAEAGLAGWGHASRIGGTHTRRRRLDLALAHLDGRPEADRLVPERALESINAGEPLDLPSLERLGSIASDATSTGHLLSRRVLLVLRDNAGISDVQEAASLAEQAMLLRGNETVLERAACLAGAIGVAQRGGDWRLADRLIDALRSIGSREGDPRSRWQPEVFATALLDIRGHDDEAMIVSKAALRLGRILELHDAAQTFGLRFTALHLLAGSLVPIAERLRASIPRYDVPIQRALRGIAEFDVGDTPTAARELRAALAGLDEPSDIFSSGLLACATLLAARLDDVDALQRLAAQLERRPGGWVFIGWGGPCLGPIDWYRALVAERLGDVAAAQTLFDASESQAASAGANGWLDAPMRLTMSLAQKTA